MYLVNLDSINEIEEIRGKNGTFYVKKIKKINELKKYISEKCQTVTYLGFSKNEMLEFVKKNNLNGVDRMFQLDKLWI